MRLLFPLPWSLAILLCLVGLIPSSLQASGWSYRNGEPISGDVVAFDFDQKILRFHDMLSDRKTEVSTRDLSLRSRQRLLFSPLFRQNDREKTLEGESLTSPEKRHLPLLILGVSATLLFLGFWAAAWFILGKWSPALALTGFIGTWIVLIIFAGSYAFLSARFGGSMKITLLGVAVSIAMTPLYLSAVYNCPYLKAILVLVSHLFVGFCFLSIGIVATEAILGTERTDQWWNEQVFEPVGLIAPSPPDSTIQTIP